MSSKEVSFGIDFDFDLSNTDFANAEIWRSDIASLQSSTWGGVAEAVAANGLLD